MSRIHANNFGTTINGAISDVDVSIVLTSVTGFPSIGAGVTCNLTLQSGSTIEIVTATARSSNTITVTRAAEGTSAVAWADGSVIGIRPTADSVDRKLDTATTATSGKRLKSDGSSWIASSTTMPDAGTSGKVIIGNGTNYVESTPAWPTAASTSGKRIKSNGTDFVMSTTTLPDSGTTGKFIIGDGTNYVESTSTIPTSAGSTALKHLKSDGTNYVLTTATISDTPSTAGKILVSDGTNWITSTPTFPNTSATTRKKIVSDGTNWIASTETWAVPGTSKNYLKSDGTNWTSAAPDTSPVASTLAAWDANNNLSTNNILTGYATTATSAGTRTLTVASARAQVYTGTTTHTQVMPVVSTLSQGTVFVTTNYSTGVVTVQSSGANTIQAMAANTTLILQSNATSGTGASVWDVVAYIPAASDITGTGSLVRATTPTLITPVLGVATATSINFGQSALSFYETGTFTPTFTTATVGDLSVAYTTQLGVYRRIGDGVFFRMRVAFTPTYTTASGQARFSGFPYAVNSGAGSGGATVASGNTNLVYPAGFSVLVGAPAASQVYASILAQGSSSTSTALTTAQFLTGVAYDIMIVGTYMI